jgi:Fe-S oxidoreductase
MALTEQQKVELGNIKEEISSAIGNCISCGMCKTLCPVFKVLKEEAISPRGHVIDLKEGVIEKLVFECNLCKGCEVSCPLDLKICDAIRKAREVLDLKGQGLKGNEEMVSNIRKYGNPFGKGEVEKDKLYCC